MTAPTDHELQTRAATLGESLRQQGLMVATAESCTGGWISKVLTDNAGSSDYVGTGLVTYSNAAKQHFLGVSATNLDAHGAVSEPVVRDMAEGACRATGADLAVAVSGIAGPGGGTPEKPVGTVWFAWSRTGHPTHTAVHCFNGDRESVRRQTVACALAGLLELSS